MQSCALWATSVVSSTAEPPSPCRDLEERSVRPLLEWCFLQVATSLCAATVKPWDLLASLHRPWSIIPAPCRRSLLVFPCRAPKMGVQVLLFLLVSWRKWCKEHSRLASWHLSCEMGITCCFCLTETPRGWTRAVKVQLRSETHWHTASRNA